MEEIERQGLMIETLTEIVAKQTAAFAVVVSVLVDRGVLSSAERQGVIALQGGSDILFG